MQRRVVLRLSAKTRRRPDTLPLAAVIANERAEPPFTGSGVGTPFAAAEWVLPWIAAAWLGGLFVGAQWQPSVGPILAGVGLLGALAVVVHGQGLVARRLWAAPLACLAFSCGLGVARTAPAPCSMVGDTQLTARVTSVRHGVEDARIELRALEGRSTETRQALSQGVTITAKLEGDEIPAPGSVVAFHAVLRPRTVLHNPSPHPNLSPHRGTGCWARWQDPQFELLEAPRGMTAIEQARSRVRKHMNQSLSQEVAGVARALVLGDGGALGYEQRRAIASVGLAHLFAVSGLHVALVSGTLVRSLHWLLRGSTLGFDPRRLAAAIGVPLTLLHALFAGGSPSAWRAATTAALTWGLVALGRRPSAPAMTAAASLILSAPDPSMALRPAFLLSIVATSAILSAPRTPNGSRWPRLRASATISARTLIATTPMVWWWFGGVPLVGWLTNILVLPLGSWVVIPAAHLFALTTSLPALAELAGNALTISVRALLSLCDAFTPFAVTRTLPPLDIAQGVIVLAGCLLLLIAPNWRRRFLVISASALLWLGADFALAAREQPMGTLRMTFVDVGQGDATLIDFPDGRLGLVDTGQGGRHPAVRELRGLLAARRRTRVDLLVITHGHPDHYGGLPELLHEFEIGEIWLNGQLLTEERDGAMATLVTSAMARDTRIRFAPELCDRRPRFGGVELEVLWPCPRYDAALGLNDNSIALRLAYRRRSFLLTGDLERQAERMLVEGGRLRNTDVLKVAHHGSRTSSSAGFLAAVRPSISVISSGAGNRYGHPSPEVLSRLLDAGAEVHRTDIQGGVIITTDGESIEVRR